MDKASELFEELLLLIRTLRGDEGCPWDRKQTMQTLRTYLEQEFRELMEVLEGNTAEKIQEEMGDLIFLLLFAAEIARDRGEFSIGDVLENVKEKMIRRHPHVFGDLKADDIAQVRKNWKVIKAKERLSSSRQSLRGKIPRHLPALLQASWALRKTAQPGFAGNDRPVEVLAKLEEGMENIRKTLTDDDREMAKYALGELFFTLIHLCSILKTNPEEVVRESVLRFVTRFEYAQDNLQSRNNSPREAST